jgi:hypothetical protein
VVRELFGNDPIEVERDNLLIELLNLEGSFIGGMREINVTAARIDYLHLFAALEHDPCLRKRRRDLDRRLVVHQIAVNDRLAIRVRINRVAEYLYGMERGGRREADLNGVEVL